MSYSMLHIIILPFSDKSEIMFNNKLIKQKMVTQTGLLIQICESSDWTGSLKWIIQILWNVSDSYY